MAPRQTTAPALAHWAILPFIGLALLSMLDTLRAEDLVADLSEHQVSIGSGFAGAQIIVFGAFGGSDDANDPPGIVIVVRGENDPVTVRRKERVAGVWINRSAVSFQSVPRLFHVLTNRPLEEIASTRQLARLQIGLEHLRLQTRTETDADKTETFREALIGRNQAGGLFVEDTTGVLVRGQNLFRATLTMPSSIPEGLYRVEVYLFRDGQVVGAQSFRLPVEKVGFENFVNRFSRDYALAYGIVAVIVAVATGWGASSLFRRV